jgi:phenylpropionate dioxygenase-like ring-hydroxylating dioxygenase large terminal subunit
MIIQLLISCLFFSVYSFVFNNNIRARNNICSYAHKWYVIGDTDEYNNCKPKKVVINGSPITIWKDNNNQFMGIHDVCPHRGASLSKGRIDKHLNCVVCPYHTFKFNKKGRLVQTPGQTTIRPNQNFNHRTDVPYYDVINFNGWLYLYNEPKYEITQSKQDESSIWVEPEAYDDTFKYVKLKKDFKIDARTVTENSLDILHISEVHSFGNKKRPLPLNDKLEKIGEGHYKATYEYMSGEDSLASKVFGIKRLVVENEYILPHYTVARVRFGDFVNTIVTSALPTSENTTTLHVKAYRNNWVYNSPMLDFFFDKMTKDMMKKTLNEDKSVIETIYYDYREGNFITKYDELTKLYREDYHNFVLKDPRNN